MDVFRKKLKNNCSFLLKFVFRCIGVSVNSKESFAYNLYSLLMVTSMFLYPWSNLHALLHNLDNFDVIANALFNFVGGLAASGKVFIMIYNRSRLRYIFEELERLQEEYNIEEWSQKEIYNTNRKMCFVLINFYISLAYLYGICFVERLKYDDHNKWRTPVSEVSVINITYSPNYEIAWIYQVLAVTLISSGYCITDLLIASITVDLSVQFKIFQNEIKQMFNNAHHIVNTDQESDKQWIYLNRAIKSTVIRHLSLIDMVTEVEKVSSPMILLGVTGSLCVLCFSIYYASVLPLFDPKAMQSYLEISMITFSLFFICYCGTELSHASASVAKACYEIDFVGTDTRLQKSLMMIIMRSQKPVGLTVGGFANLSLPVFVTILRSTYTYFTVLTKSSDSNNNGN